MADQPTEAPRPSAASPHTPLGLAYLRTVEAAVQGRPDLARPAQGVAAMLNEERHQLGFHGGIVVGGRELMLAATFAAFQLVNRRASVLLMSATPDRAREVRDAVARVLRDLGQAFVRVCPVTGTRLADLVLELLELLELVLLPVELSEPQAARPPVSSSALSAAQALCFNALSSRGHPDWTSRW